MKKVIEDTKKELFSIDRPMSPSSASAILQDAELWKYNKENPQPDTKASAFGKALHCLLLEPEKFETSFYVPKTGPTNPKTENYYGRDSKAYQTWFEGAAELADGKTIVLPKEFEELKIMQKIFRPVLENLLKLGRGAVVQTERKVEWIDPVTGQPCLGSIDAMAGNTIIDIKTTSDLSDYGVHKKIKDAYFIQAGTYAEAVKLIDNVDKIKVYLLFIRAKPPYSMRLIKIDEDTLDSGILEFRRAIKVYRHCVENGFTVYRGFETMGLPRWKQMEIQAANGKG